MVAESLHFIAAFLQRNPLNDGIFQGAVVLSAVGFYAQAMAIKPKSR